MKNNKSNLSRNIAAFCLMLSVVLSSSMITPAKNDNKSLAGEIIVSGRSLDGNEPSVLLNGEKAFSGRTFFSSGVIATSENANATVRLGKLGYVTLAPNSILSLSFSENRISGKLSAGQAEVFNNKGVEVNIERTENTAVNVNKQTQTTGGMTNNSVLIPLIIFVGIVATAAIYSITNGGDDNGGASIVSPTR